MKRTLLALLLLAPITARAADLASSYNVPGTGTRTPPFVMLCPSSDGSNSTVPCAAGAGNTLAYTLNGTASVTTSSSQILAAGAVTHALNICALPTNTASVWLNLSGGSATSGSGTFLVAGACASFGAVLPIPTGAITAISSSAQSVTLTGG